MNTEPLLSLLQFADGLFPAGSHAHSGGLETFASFGLIGDAGGVEEFVRSALEWSIAPCDGVAAVACLRAAAAEDLAACLEIDLRLDAAKAARETREASRQMGRQVLRVAGQIETHPVLDALAGRAALGEIPGHQATAFGRGGSGVRVAGARNGFRLSALLRGGGGERGATVNADGANGRPTDSGQPAPVALPLGPRGEREYGRGDVELRASAGVCGDGTRRT